MKRAAQIGKMLAVGLLLFVLVAIVAKRSDGASLRERNEISLKAGSSCAFTYWRRAAISKK